MKRPMMAYIVSIACAAVAVVSLRCATGGNDNLAGATGTGNPSGGSTVVALLADTAQSNALARAIHGDDNAAGLAMPPQGLPIQQFPIADEDDLAFTVRTATVTVQRIAFLLEDGHDCASLVNNAESSLSCDSDAIVLEGPFAFDMLTGTSEPPLDSLRLPAAGYVGIRLHIGRNDSGASNAAPANAAIRIGGTFVYNDTIRDFSMQAAANAPCTYLKPGAPSNASPDFTTHFIVRLLTHKWLDSLTIKSCLDRGDIPLDAQGRLDIGATSPGAGTCQNVPAQLRSNVVNSGRLDIFSK